MSTLPVVLHLLRELASRRDAFRVPEPDLIMEDADQVASFHAAGREDGVMAPVYLFHATHVSQVIRPGDTVVDLGCGPANQLGLVARLNPDAQFIGVDLSDQMLTMAESNLRTRGIDNVTLRHGDITNLDAFKDASVDAIMSTVVLHHLPDEASLFTCFKEIQRVLKPDGGLYLVDFGHLKTEATIRYMAYQYKDRQPDLFTIDYLNSLRAAFDLATWREGWSRHLQGFSGLYSTFLAPYMIAAKSPSCRDLPVEAKRQLNRAFHEMPPYHQADFRDLTRVFRLGGLRTPNLWGRAP